MQCIDPKLIHLIYRIHGCIQDTGYRSKYSDISNTKQQKLELNFRIKLVYQLSSVSFQNSRYQLSRNSQIE